MAERLFGARVRRREDARLVTGRGRYVADVTHPGMLHVAVPLAGAGLGAAAAVAFARGVGEFGATILFAGSFQGSTQTLPLAVYSLFDANLDQAISIGVLLIVVSAAILLGSKLLVRAWISSRSTSPSRGDRSIFAPS